MGARKPPSDRQPQTSERPDDNGETFVGTLSPSSTDAPPTAPSSRRGKGGFRLADFGEEGDLTLCSDPSIDDDDDDIPVSVDEVRSADPKVPRSIARVASSSASTTDRPEHPLAFEETLHGRYATRKATDRIGTLIAGRYRLLRLLGEGGMGTVFEASHTALGKRVAVKILSRLFAGHPDASARFMREARAASAVESEHIVQVFDVGEDIDAGLFMVMEHLQGEDLAARIARGRLRSQQAASIAIQVTRALERAHAAGIVHRDLKPGNVFLTRADDGSVRVKVLDFGIAKLVRDAHEGRVGITKGGMAVGTPQYMSPEQTQGLATVDGRTDVYSLGAVLHECLTGSPPYPELASYEMTILKIMTEPPPRVSSIVADVEPAMEQLIVEMMGRSPENRPTFAEVRTRLTQLHTPPASTRVLLERLSTPHVPLVPSPPRTGGGVIVETSKSARPAKGRASKTNGIPAVVVGVLAMLATIAFVLGLAGLVRWSSALGTARDAAPVASLADTHEGSATSAAPVADAPMPAKGISAPSSHAAVNGAPVAPSEPATGGAIVAQPVGDPHDPAAHAVAAGALPAADPTAHAGEKAASLIAEAQKALDHGDPPRALKLASEATALAPASADGWLTLAAAADLNGDHAGAHRAYVACTHEARGSRVDECTTLAAAP